ncbi:hypothetical protein OTU49_000477 [Cherax quadricarinatus]|uniref:Secreted protein n=1 Tax=Cherax quadricarinatus TaxID=27406 RepID=A0AAW0YDZ6_CHEQU
MFLRLLMQLAVAATGVYELVLRAPFSMWSAVMAAPHYNNNNNHHHHHHHQPNNQPNNASLAHNYEFICEFLANSEVPVVKYRSKRTGLHVVLASVEGPLVSGYFTLGLRIYHRSLSYYWRRRRCWGCVFRDAGS